MKHLATQHIINSFHTQLYDIYKLPTELQHKILCTLLQGNFDLKHLIYFVDPTLYKSWWKRHTTTHSYSTQTNSTSTATSTTQTPLTTNGIQDLLNQLKAVQEDNAFTTSLWQKQRYQEQHELPQLKKELKNLKQTSRRIKPQVKTLKSATKELETTLAHQTESTITILPTKCHNPNNNNRLEYTNRIKEGFLHIKHAYTLSYSWMSHIAVEFLRVLSDDWDEQQFPLPDESTIRTWAEQADEKAMAQYLAELAAAPSFHVHHDGSKDRYE